MAGNGYHWRLPRPRPAPPVLPWEWATNYYQQNLELSRILPQPHHWPITYYIRNSMLGAFSDDNGKNESYFQLF